ncbi:cell surface glycoprotein CD200 receptor 1 isoform X3 [Lacerta agilis]|uniref:cell surface glycoprotein CD200 receptor 1 isoform X3 n=1 Tax=Lacerta agilis TaxID=80427 RepID=UPI001419ECE0|nr:cell surface glycoprotein CD200 receptor 1 isoform X3 [Lacerta agilis]
MKRCSLYWWLNIHQNGYRGDIIACAMEAKCGINFVLKNWSACALLTVTVMMATIGSFPARGSIQNKSVQHHANSSVTAMMVNNMKPQLAEVPPEASLIHDDISGTAICKAVAGKPAAQISWSPEGEYNTKSEYLLNGTQTVTSIYKVNNSEGSEVTCFVSHPAWKESLNISLDGQSKKKEDVTITILFSSFAGVLGILLSVFIYLLYRRKREVDASKSPETMSRPSIQESELEPYAIFVQVENVIYEKAGDFPQSE